MTLEQSFLQAILANPKDKGPRLIYADYLDDQGDPRAESLRSLRPAPAKREQDWLEPMRKLDPTGELFHAAFTQGFVTAVELPARMLVKQGEKLFRSGPLIHDLLLYKVRKAGPALAKSAFLRYIDRLEIADWITPDDAAPLAALPWLGRLESLRRWPSRPGRSVRGR
jgi:uncharacterized protein (TIGR02996 family)